MPGVGKQNSDINCDSAFSTFCNISLLTNKTLMLLDLGEIPFSTSFKIKTTTCITFSVRFSSSNQGCNYHFVACFMATRSLTFHLDLESSDISLNPCCC